MIFPQKTSSGATAVAACVVASALAACAVPGRAAVDTQNAQRILVKLVRPSDDTAAIAAEAARVAAVPVRYAAAVSPAWHALALRCATAAQCDAAIGRLRGAAAIYEAVEIDGRKTGAAS
jgi:hypothetical protein